LAIAAATAVFRFNLGMLTVLAGSCAVGVVLRLLGVI
jgi:chromate transporter